MDHAHDLQSCEETKCRVGRLPGFVDRVTCCKAPEERESKDGEQEDGALEGARLGGHAANLKDVDDERGRPGDIQPCPLVLADGRCHLS